MSKECGDLSSESSCEDGASRPSVDITSPSPAAVLHASINVPLAIYVHPEDPIVVHVPDGWQKGEDFTVHPVTLVMHRRDGSAAIISLDGHGDCWSAHLPIDLDGRHGFGLLYWLEFDLICNAGLLDELLDMEVPKKLEVKFGNLPEHQPNADMQSCRVLESPDVAVIRRKGDKSTCIQ